MLHRPKPTRSVSRSTTLASATQVSEQENSFRAVLGYISS